MVMDPQRISSIAVNLMNYGYLSKSSKPSEILSYVNPINSTVVKKIAMTTNILREDVFSFFNTTRPCIIDISNNSNDTSESNIITEKIFSSCFYFTDPPTFDCKIHGWNSNIIEFICAFAYIFMVIMMFFKKRKFLAPTLCWGRPGCLVTVNMLDSYENRYGYALSFGLTVSSCFSVISSEYSDIVGLKAAHQLSLLPSYFLVFVKMTLAAIISVSGAPFLICQSFENKLVGGLIGLFMSLFWFVYELTWKIPILLECNLGMLKLSGFRMLSLFMDLPKHICLLLLIMKFTWTVIITVKSRLKQRGNGQGFVWMQTDKVKSENEYIFSYVASLLKQEKIQFDDNKQKFNFKRLHGYHPGFKFSLRIVLSAFVSCLAIYTMVIGIVIAYEILFGFRKNEGMFSIGAIDNLHLQYNLPRIKNIKNIIICMKISMWVATLFSVCLFLFVMKNSLMWYRFHILSLRKGDWSFLPPSLKKHDSISPTGIMVASMTFAGYQVAYSVWGFVIIFTMFFVVLLIITTQIFLPISSKESSFLLNQIVSLWPTILVGCIVILLQRLLARFILLIEKDVLAVDNRRIFHGAAFFLFYFNIFIGIFSSFLRIIYGLTFGVLFYQRLQKSSLPRSFENWDNGYMAYIGYILLEHYHTNPVLQCFVHLLLEVNQKQFLKDDSNLYSSQYLLSTRSTVKTIHKTRALNRWHLYVVLLQNPSLLKFRAHRITLKNDSTNETRPRVFFRTITNLFSRSGNIRKNSRDFVENIENNESAKSSRKFSDWSQIGLEKSF